MRRALLLLAICAAAPLCAQTPTPTPPSAPAEIVPPKAPSTPAPGHNTIEVTTPPTALSPGSTAAAPGGEAPKNPVDALSNAELDQILAALKERYADPAALSEEQLKRATVQGLLERLGSRATLETPDGLPTAPSPFHYEILSQKIGYLRLGSLEKERPAELDAALTDLQKKGVAAEVLDLRATPPGVDFELAAEVCRRWVAKGKPLFTVHRREGATDPAYNSTGDPLGKGMLIVLVGSENAGSAEIVAGTLRALAGAMVIGQATRGEAAEMAETALASGRRLRFAVAEVKLPNGQSIGPGGIVPDLPVEMPVAVTARLLQEESEKGLATGLTEPERPHLNEAALVAGRNPELDAMENSTRLRVSAKASPRDATLQRAVDLVASVAVFQKTKP